MDFSLYGLLEWVQLNEKKAVLEIVQSASNLLFSLYVISYIFNKKAAFLVAFLLVEIYGNSSISSGLTKPEYYRGYAFLYMVTYWVVFYKYHMVKSLVGYVILVLFELAMSVDAIYFPDDETYIDTNYTSIIVLIHLYIVATLIDWRLLRAFLGEGLGVMGSWLRINYNLSFIWYTVIYRQKPTS